MAGYRQIHTKIWKDEYIIELDPLEKLLWIYLFSNELSSISGIYKIPSRVIANETGLEKEFVDDTLAKFEQDGKIAREDGFLWIVKMQEYHSNASPTTIKKVLTDINAIPDNGVKRKYLEHYKGIDTPSIPYRYPIDTNLHKDKDKDKAKEKEKEEEKEEKKTKNSSPPASSRQFFDSGWHERVFVQVTQIPGIPGSDLPKVLEALEAMRTRFKTEGEMIAYLRPYFENWTSRKTKDGRKYSRSNCAWLYDLALAGEPLPSDVHPPGEKPDPDCPKCGGLGVLASNVKFGEAGFGKLARCDCVRVREEVKV